MQPRPPAPPGAGNGPPQQPARALPQHVVKRTRIGCGLWVAAGCDAVVLRANDTLDSGVQHVSTPTRALVSPAGSIQGTSGAQTVLGSVRLRITATPTAAGQHLFLGIGPPVGGSLFSSSRRLSR